MRERFMWLKTKLSIVSAGVVNRLKLSRYQTMQAEDFHAIRKLENILNPAWQTKLLNLFLCK